MSRKLGEALIEKGIIDPTQLKRALDVQLIYGGHLGTCLVELGFLDVDELGKVLSEQFRVNHAAREKLLEIEASVIATLPAKLADRHQVVPFELAERTLHVAIVDPRNLLALDEISFVSGHRVEAWVAPEILVQRAIERYYGVPRKLRHITVSGQLSAEASAPRKAPARKTAAAVAEAPSTRQASSQPVREPRERPRRRLIEAPVAVAEPPVAVAEPQVVVDEPPVAMAEPPVAMAEPPAAPAEPLAAPAEPAVAVAEPPPGPPQPAKTPRRPAPARRTARREPAPAPDASPPQEAFVEQARPRVHLQSESGASTGNKRSIDWIKLEKNGRQSWCELYELPLEHEHFRHLGGVYVIWHAGQHPVIRVGQGYVKTELTTLRLDPRLAAKNEESKLFVTWASVPRQDRDGIERFLADMLDPEIPARPPEVEPIVVNLPC